MLVILNNLHNFLRFSVSSLMLHHASPKTPEKNTICSGNFRGSWNGDEFFSCKKLIPRHVWWKSWTARFVQKKMGVLHLQSYSHTFWGGVSLDLLWKDPPKSLLQNKIQTPHKALKWKNSEKRPGQDPLSVSQYLAQYPHLRNETNPMSQTIPGTTEFFNPKSPPHFAQNQSTNSKNSICRVMEYHWGRRIKRRLKCTRKQLT